MVLKELFIVLSIKITIILSLFKSKKISLLPQKRHSGDKLSIPQNKRKNECYFIGNNLLPEHLFVSKYVAWYFSGTVTNVFSSYLDQICEVEVLRD